MFSGKHGSFRIYTASTLTIIFKYENIKLKNKECPAEEAQHLNYRIKRPSISHETIPLS
jgi:hypothetical protein